MKTFKQFVEVPNNKPKGPSTTPTQDKLKSKHARERENFADRNKTDKDRSSDEFQQMTAIQKTEIGRAKRSDKSLAKRKADAEKKKGKKG